MFKLFKVSALCAVFGTGATAATTGFELTISGSKLLPTFTLSNTSTSALLTGFTFSIGNTAFNWDAVYNTVGPDGGTLTVNNPDMDNLGNIRTDLADLSFTDFNAGEFASFTVDPDPDGGGNVAARYDRVMFNNGTAPNAVLTATFDDGLTAVFVTPDVSPEQDSYTFNAVAPIPLPAGLPLLLAGLGGLALVRRRGKAH